MKKLICILLALCLTACGAAPESSGSSKVLPRSDRLSGEQKDNIEATEEKAERGEK